MTQPGGDDFGLWKDWQVNLAMVVMALIGLCMLAGWIYAFWSLAQPECK